MRVLDVSGLSRYFGGLKAVEDVTLHVDAGEIVSLIGPNGAGKTTFFNCVTGVYGPTSGTIHFTRGEGHSPREIAGLAAHQVTPLGMARTFQNIRLFPEMTVIENVMVGRHCRTRSGAWSAIVRSPAFRREERDTAEKALAHLAFVGLAGRDAGLARNLPYGDQRRLEIARGLATDPALVLLDEPAAGMNPQETQSLMALIRKIRDTGVSVLLIEHHMKLVMGISDRIYVLDHGVRIAEGNPASVCKNPKVIAAYLGQEA